MQIPVRFINLPKAKFLASPLPKTIHAEIKTSGAKHLFLNFKGEIDPVEIDLSSYSKNFKGNAQFALSTIGLIGNLSKIINTEIELIQVKPDSIYFNFGRSCKKIVPVKADLSINFDPLYNYHDKIKITPSFVTLYGDSLSLQKVDSVKTEKIVLNQLNQNVRQQTKLIIPEDLEARTSLSVENVWVEVDVDKLTESFVSVPVEVLNVSPDNYLKIFPDKIKIKYRVGMNDFEKIQANQFSVVADFKNYKPGNSQLKIELKKTPENVKVLQLSHQKIEFIIRKKK